MAVKKRAVWQKLEFFESAVELRDAAERGDVKAFQKQVVRRWAKPLKRLRRVLNRSEAQSSANWLVDWSAGRIALSGRERELAAALIEIPAELRTNCRRRTRKRLAELRQENLQAALNELLEDPSGPLSAWESLAVLELLFRGAEQLTAESFADAIARIVVALQNVPATGTPLEASSAAREFGDAALAEILQSIEMPLVGVWLLERAGIGGLPTEPAMEALNRMLKECSGADGLVHGSLLPELPSFLAPLTRCSLWAHVLDRSFGTEEAEVQFARIVQRCATLLLPASRTSSGDEPSGSEMALRPLLELLLPLTKVERPRLLAKLVRQCGKPAGRFKDSRRAAKGGKSSDTATSNASKSTAEKTGDTDSSSQEQAHVAPLFLPSVQSDTAQVAVLRTSLRADADLLTVNWSSADVQLLLAAAGVRVIDGHWACSLRIDGEHVAPPETWTCSCWFSDSETDFVELEGSSDSSLKIVRQVLVSRTERFALLTDSVRCEDAGRKVQLTTTLPLVSGVVSEPDHVTRELHVATARRTARLFPLWLEDDRLQHAIGSFREHDGQLELSAMALGGVTMPLALDWHPDRSVAPADWCRLTVTEARRIVGPGEASGFRLRVGKRQVLLYRSLVAPGTSRAVLGLHTWHETVFSRVDPKKCGLQSLVEVETTRPEALAPNR